MAVLGFGVLAVGLACIFLPAPAVIVIPLGLAILATEFRWARRLLQPVLKLVVRLKALALRVLGRPSPPAGPKAEDRRR